jgi:hypothetical protein
VEPALALVLLHVANTLAQPRYAAGPSAMCSARPAYTPGPAVVYSRKAAMPARISSSSA